MTYIVLGSNGFIGSNIFNTLKKNNLEVLGLSKQDFNMQNRSDYAKFDFSNSIIIDCIASIDDKNAVFEVNVNGLKYFIDYLNLNHNNFKYIYFSTTSTQISEQVEQNDYVKSKFLAENYIKENVLDYKIIRLIFPFGKGENKNRLISRFINKIQNGEKLEIDNVSLNLTPISYLNDNFLDTVKNEFKDINFTDGKVYELKDVVDCIYKLLNIDKNYKFNEEKYVQLEIENTVEVSNYATIKKNIKDSYEL